MKVWEVKYRALNDYDELVWFTMDVHAISKADAKQKMEDAGGLDVEVVCELEWTVEMGDDGQVDWSTFVDYHAIQNN